MDIELLAKLVTVTGSFFAPYKFITEFVFSKKSRLREDFKFIKKFIADLKPDTHPSLIEKGYLAITVDSTLTAKEITYFLSLHSPAQALKKYSFARKYLEFKGAITTENAHVTFKLRADESG